MRNLSVPLALCFKLINTLASTSFAKTLNKPWNGAEGSENIQTIQKKIADEIISTRDRFLKFNDSEEAISYLECLQKIKGIKLNKSDKKGLIRSLDLDGYVGLDTFLCEVSASYRPIGAIQGAQFECHELIRSIMDYFLMKDTVENGSGHIGLDKMIQHLLKTKPSSFFRSGYLADLFVIDRLALITADANYRYLRCHKNYLSTLALVEENQNPEDGKHFELYKVN